MSIRSIALKRVFIAGATVAVVVSSHAQTLDLNNQNQIVGGTWSVVNATKSVIEINSGLDVTSAFNASYQNPNAISYGGDTITVDSGATFNATNAEIGLLSNLLVNGIPYAEAGTSAIFKNYGTTTFTASPGGSNWIEFDQFTNYSTGILNADSLDLVGNGTITNAGQINISKNLNLFGTTNQVANWTNVLNNTNSLTVGGNLQISNYGGLVTSGVGATAFLNNVTISSGQSTSIQYQNGTVTPNIPTELLATNGGTVVVGNGTAAAFFSNGQAPAAYSPVGGAGQASGGIVNVDGAGSSITINANAVSNLVEQDYAFQQPDVVMSATGGGNLTINAQTITEEVQSAGVYTRDRNGTYVFGIWNPDYITPSNAYMFADGAGSQLNLNASVSLNLDYHVVLGYAYGESTTSPVFLEPNIPSPQINATNGGTVNIDTPTLNAGGGGFTASGAGSSINVLANTINLTSSFTAESGAKVEIGSMANPVDTIQGSGGFLAGGPGNLTPALVDIYATHYDSPPVSEFSGSLVAYTGSVLNLTGETYLGGEIYSSWNGFGSPTPTSPLAQVNLKESQSVTGPGIIEAYFGDVTVTSPVINFSTFGASVYSGTVLFDASNSVSLTNGGPYAAFYPTYGSVASSIIVSGGTFDAISPSITLGDGITPTYLSSNGPQSMILLQTTNGLGALTPGTTVSLLDAQNYQGEFASTGYAAYNGGVIDLLAPTVTIDGTSSLQIGSSYYAAYGPALTSYLLVNGVDISGLDFQNSGLLTTSGNGSIVIGGSTFENESTAIFNAGANTTSYLGYNEGFTGGLPNAAPTANLTPFAATNAGSLNVNGTLFSNGSLTNSGLLEVADSGLDLVDAPSSAYTSGPYPYRPAKLEFVSGDFTNTGNIHVTGSSLNVDSGSVYNSGTFNVADDLSAPNNYPGPLDSSVTVSGDFHNYVSSSATPSVATFTGSSLTVQGVLTNDSTFSVTDDATGGTSYAGTPLVGTPNNYPVQYSTITATGIVNTGLFNSSESTLIIGSHGLNNSGVFNAFADDALPTPAGTTISIAEGTLTNSGTMLLAGSTVTVGTGLVPAIVGVANEGGVLNLTNDYTSYLAGTASTPLLGSITVASGDVQNGAGAINLTGTTLNLQNGNLVNDGGALNVTSDLSAPSALGVVQGNLQIAGNLLVTDGTVTIQGSTLGLGGDIEIGATGSPQTGTFVITDDSLGNHSVISSYLSWAPNPNITVSGSGYFESKETYFSASTISNRDNGTFLLVDDQIMAQPVGTILSADSITNQGAAQFQLVGSQVNVSNGITNTGTSGALKGATISLTNDVTPAMAGSGNVVASTINIYNGDFNNEINAHLNLNGGFIQLYNGDVHNNGASHVDVEADALGEGGGISANNFVNRDYGTVDIATSGTFGYSGIYLNNNFTNRDQGLVNIGQAGTLYVPVGLLTNGVTSGDAAKINNYGSITIGAQGLFQTGSGSAIKNFGSINTWVASSTLTLGNVGDAAQSAGTLGGNGTIGSAGHTINVVNNAGTVNPGDPQILTIIGNYVQGANGTTIFNIDGPGGAGVGYDQLNVVGTLTLDGTIDLVFGNLPGTTTPYSPTGVLNLFNFVGTDTNFSTLKFEETINGVTTQGLGNGFTVGFHNAAVPEPSPMVALGVAGFGFLLRRRKRSA